MSTQPNEKPTQPEHVINPTADPKARSHFWVALIDDPIVNADKLISPVVAAQVAQVYATLAQVEQMEIANELAERQCKALEGIREIYQARRQ